MPFRQCCVAVAVTLTLPGLLRAQSAPAPMDLGRAWDAEHLQLPAPPLVRHPDVIAVLQRLRQSAPDLIQTEPIGQSVEGRSINHVWLGRGSLKVLLWSQMHGDEPTATVALLDVLDYVRRHRDEPFVGRLLDRLELHMVPMLNPDGAERFQRRNAQGIDINRDALLLQSPEGLALKTLAGPAEPAARIQPSQPELAHVGRQDRAGRRRSRCSPSRSTRRGATTRGGFARRRSARSCAMRSSRSSPAGSARYDDAFEVRAFGDNLTKWGTSVVLIETGAYPGPDSDRMLVRVNFVGLLTAIDALASGEIDRANPARYEIAAHNDSMLLHTIVSNALIVTGTGVAPFKGDIGIGANRSIRTASGRRSVGLSARIEDIGDLRVYGALERIDAGGLVAAPIRRSRLKVGDTIRLERSPDQRAVAGGGTAGGSGVAQARGVGEVSGRANSASGVER